MSTRLGRVFAQAESRWLGAVDFSAAHEHNLKQSELSRRDGRARLSWFEPKTPILTLGRRLHGDRSMDIAQTLQSCGTRHIAVIEADRGGQATLHLPGQLVVFVAIPGRREEVAGVVNRLFDAVESLEQLRGIELRRGEGDQTGLWMEGSKIASAGLRVQQGVIRHGMSVNVAIDRTIVSGLTLCGHRDASYIDLRSIALVQNDRPPKECSVERVASVLDATLCGSSRLFHAELDGP
ncbi:MAG TPA: hypothetical protein DCQ06_10850 [Myxococcales bacterium]|nr:hypothetical protein [Myxococcales bacterium]HAN32085.1 hypothetical protein [Myxococcales bacterium]